MTDRLKQLEKLESCVMSFWDRLDEDMQEEIREILDIDIDYNEEEEEEVA